MLNEAPATGVFHLDGLNKQVDKQAVCSDYQLRIFTGIGMISNKHFKRSSPILEQ